jgi:hypothetical protein
MSGITDEDREVARAVLAAYRAGQQWPGQPIYERTLTTGERLTAFVATVYPETVRLMVERPDNLGEVFITTEALEYAHDIGAAISMARHGTQPGG